MLALKLKPKHDIVKDSKLHLGDAVAKALTAALTLSTTHAGFESFTSLAQRISLA